MTCKSKMQFSTVAGWNERTNEPYSSLLGLSKRGPRFSFHPTLLLPLRLLHLRGIFREEEMSFSWIARFFSTFLSRSWVSSSPIYTIFLFSS